MGESIKWSPSEFSTGTSVISVKRILLPERIGSYVNTFADDAELMGGKKNIQDCTNLHQDATLVK